MKVNLRNIIVEYVYTLLLEGPIQLKKPVTLPQKNAFIKLVKWSANKMGAPNVVVIKAIDNALKKDDWSASIELVRDYCVMKHLPFKLG